MDLLDAALGLFGLGSGAATGAALDALPQVRAVPAAARGEVLARVSLRASADALRQLGEELGRHGAACFATALPHGPELVLSEAADAAGAAGEQLALAAAAPAFDTPSGAVLDLEVRLARRAAPADARSAQVEVLCAVPLSAPAQSVARALREALGAAVRSRADLAAHSGLWLWDRTFWPYAAAGSGGGGGGVTVTFGAPFAPEPGSVGVGGAVWESRAPLPEQRRRAQEREAPAAAAPCFRESQSLCWRWRRRPAGGALRSPHRSPLLRLHSLAAAPRSRVALVRGDFDYCHYGQGGTDDKGWGCAYRSLQMCASWLRLQGWAPTPRPPHGGAGAGQDAGGLPSIRDIQALLCGMGVMDAGFAVGCQQWIGSQELGWALGSLFPGVECRFLFCSGLNADGLAGDVERHLLSDGAPVVVCGGSLALTLLGVALERETGRAQWLVADPHYAGADTEPEVLTRATALEGGFRAAPVAWRTTDNVFHARAEYTLLLPMLPRDAAAL